MANTRLLVVEDESIVAMDIKHRAEGLGYDVLGIAASGEEAINKTEEKLPDLVLMDIVLKGKMDGIQAAQEIRERFDIPVVYLTAYSDEKTLSRAKLTGPFGYIIKPFEDRELHSAIEVALYKHKMDSKLRESEEKYRMLFQSSPNPILLLDSEGKIVYNNEKAEEMPMMAPNKVGTDFNELMSKVIHKDDLNLYNENFSKVLKGEKIEPFEIRILKDTKKLYYEIYLTLMNINNDSNVQFIAHDITGIREAEKQRVELAKEKARSELYSFVVSAIPVFATNIPPKLRNTIIKNFADRFESNMKPNFESFMEKKGITLKRDIKKEESSKIFSSYLEWLSNFLLNLGIKSDVKSSKSKYTLEFLTFPWMDDAAQNPIFSLIFRAMLIRSFTWTNLKGSVSQKSSLVDGSNSIKFEFYLSSLR
ncbi:MAG: methanogen output domain 1-containing protein [Methanobacteriaceae archaeon]|nr:methanogen output domain 1-containing protein [Methanobacteriaceae archaeon]